MFWDIFSSLCKMNDTTPNAVCKELGFSNATASYWKKAKNPPKVDYLSKIAKRFNVSTDYLLGKEKAPHNSARSFISDNSTIVKIEQKTLGEWIDEIMQLSPENRDRLQDYVELLLRSQDRDGQEEK